MAQVTPIAMATALTLGGLVVTSAVAPASPRVCRHFPPEAGGRLCRRRKVSIARDRGPPGSFGGNCACHRHEEVCGADRKPEIH